MIKLGEGYRIQKRGPRNGQNLVGVPPVFMQHHRLQPGCVLVPYMDDNGSLIYRVEKGKT